MQVFNFLFKLFFSIKRCSPIKVLPSCYVIPGDKTKVYPGCCPKLSCHGNATNLKTSLSHDTTPMIQLTSNQLIQHGALNLFANGSLKQTSNSSSSSGSSNSSSSTSSGSSSSNNNSTSSARSSSSPSSSTTSSEIKSAHPRDNKPSVLGPGNSASLPPEISSISGKTISSTGNSEPTRIAPKVVAPTIASKLSGGASVSQIATTSNTDSATSSGAPAQKISNQSELNPSNIISGAMKIAPGVINPKTSINSKVKNSKISAISTNAANTNPKTNKISQVKESNADKSKNSQQTEAPVPNGTSTVKDSSNVSNSKDGHKKRHKLTSSEKAELLKEYKRKKEEKRQLERLEQMKLRKQQADLRKLQRAQYLKKRKIKQEQHQESMAAQQTKCLAALQHNQNNSTLLSGTNSTIIQGTPMPTKSQGVKSTKKDQLAATTQPIKTNTKSSSDTGTSSSKTKTGNSSNKNSSSGKNSSTGKNTSSFSKNSVSKSNK